MSREDMLRQLNEQYIRASLAGDVEWYRTHLADDFICIESDGNLLDKAAFGPHFDSLVEEKNAIAKLIGILDNFAPAKVRAEYEACAERLRPMVCDTARLLPVPAIASATARSVPGSARRMPPATLTKTSSLETEIPARLASTASMR